MGEESEKITGHWAGGGRAGWCCTGPDREILGTRGASSLGARSVLTKLVEELCNTSASL